MPEYFPIKTNIADNEDAKSNDTTAQAPNPTVTPTEYIINESTIIPDLADVMNDASNTNYPATDISDKSVQNEGVDFLITPIMIASCKDPRKPLSLLNEGVNVCFLIQ